MNKKRLYFLLGLFCMSMATFATAQLQGSFENEKVIRGTPHKQVLLFSGNYFSWTVFGAADGAFLLTKGGSWQMTDNELVMTFEFHTRDSTWVGNTERWTVTVDKGQLSMNCLTTSMIVEETFEQTGIGSSTPLTGPWLFYGRKRKGKLAYINTDRPRKTMKILTGDRFQWIAYNVETKQFFGTGGGNYEAKNGKYIEHIGFFSRDNSRVGASLTFDFEIKEGLWHHTGFSSKGAPLFEVWKKR